MEEKIINSFFDTDNKVVAFMGKVGDIIILSFFWSLLSATILLSIPASAALYYAITKSVRGEYGIARKEMWGSLKANIRQGLVLSLLLGVYVTLLAIGWRFSSALLSDNKLTVVYWALIRLMAVPLAVILPWIIPLLARFTMSFKELFIKSFVIALHHWGTTVLLVLLFSISAFCVINIPILTILIPGSCALSSSYLVERAFKIYTAEKEETDENKWHL